MKLSIILSSCFVADLSIALQWKHDAELSNNIWTRRSDLYSSRKIFSRTLTAPQAGNPANDRARPQSSSPRRSPSAEPSPSRESGGKSRRIPTASPSRSRSSEQAGRDDTGVRDGSSPNQAGGTGGEGKTQARKTNKTIKGADLGSTGTRDASNPSRDRGGGRRPGRGRGGSRVRGGMTGGRSSERLDLGTDVGANDNQSTRPQIFNPVAGTSHEAGPSRSVGLSQLVPQPVRPLSTVWRYADATPVVSGAPRTSQEAAEVPSPAVIRPQAVRPQAVRPQAVHPQAIRPQVLIPPQAAAPIQAAVAPIQAAAVNQAVIPPQVAGTAVGVAHDPNIRPSLATATIIGKGTITSTTERSGQQSYIQRIDTDTEGRVERVVRGTTFASASSHLDGGPFDMSATQVSASGNQKVGANVVTDSTSRAIIQGTAPGGDMHMVVGQNSRVSTTINNRTPGGKAEVKVSLQGGRGAATAYSHSNQKRELNGIEHWGFIEARTILSMEAAVF